MKKRILSLLIPITLATAMFSSTKPLNVKAEEISYNSTAINADLNSTEKPDHITLSWTDDPKTTQTITWRTISSNTSSKLQYKFNTRYKI